MKKLGALVAGAAVASSLVIAPQADAAQYEVNVQCTRTLENGNAAGGQNPVTVPIEVTHPETAVSGEDYTFEFEFNPTAVSKSNFQAQKALGVAAGTEIETRYVERTGTATIAGEQVEGSVADTEWFADAKNTKLEMPNGLVLTRTAGEADTTEELTGATFTLVEEARLNADSEAKRISTWDCTITPEGDNAGAVKIVAADEQQPPAEEDEEKGGIFSGLFVILIAAAGLFGFLLPLLQGAFGHLFNFNLGSLGFGAGSSWLPLSHDHR
ncbi:hypothetical protein [Corynebacterium kozikiae]|uniref:hypothetical protein n=1 Tax=Corynebacterium kozikiae TaxID=2968469 RepID=UPI00211C8947|nr:hypothetical protein [Corynebacterium sp. 76QC2CO]MCQ9342913.1 hypothetical protein [Corynebacterium sp. 76QC2CO]